MPASLSAEYDRRLDAGVIRDDEIQRKAVGVLDSLLAELRGAKKGFLGFGRTPPPQGVYFWGGVGRGKSMVMDMFADAARSAGLKVCRFHFHDFMNAVHDRIHDPKLAKYDDPARHVALALTNEAKLLCFDEMEVRDIADAMILARVMGGFFDGGGVMVSTSNRHPDELYENGLHRERFLPFIELLKTKMTLHHFDGDTDWRQQVLSGFPAWHSPDDDKSDEAMKKAFEQLSGGGVICSASVMVKGREIVFDHTSGSVALVDFDDVCGVPLAARDYLALAERFAGLLVCHIPCLDDSRRNEARRFMWLVDAFYDRKRFLVCSAKTPIEGLYQGSVWGAEFPRTRSRLTEMTNI